MPSRHDGGAPASAYAARPWLKLYPDGVPADLPAPRQSAIGQFRATARRVGQRPAIHYFDRTVSFAELDRLSSALATALRDLGVGRGDRVALYLQNVPQFWITLLAAWKAGAIAVPLNPMFKESELEYHLNDSGASVLVSLESLYEEVARGALGRTGVRHVITTSELDFLAGLVEEPDDPCAAPVDAADPVGAHDAVDAADAALRLDAARQWGGAEAPSGRAAPSGSVPAGAGPKAAPRAPAGAGRLPPALAGSSKRAPSETLDLVELCRRLDGAPDPGAEPAPDDVALLTYTSGTTGSPKGAMNTHGNVAYNAEVYRTWMRLGPGDVVVGAAPLFHITGLIGHLAVAGLAGIPVILGYRFDAGEMLRLIERWRGTFMVAAITAYIALMNHPDFRRRDLASLRKAYSGGAPIPAAVVERFEAATGAYIHNIYGLTETTSPSHAVPYGVRAPVDPESGALSVGVPVPGAVVKVVDLDTGEELPPGEVGEILTSGPMVVAGYWQKPEETARALPGGWLHTGDVGRMDEHGWFYVIDRKKDMIIASGFKVWPREVEDVLYQHPAVREAAVIGVPDPYRGETVKAVVALKPDYPGEVTPEELIAFCRERMAAYKYPRQVEIVPELPKTLTGKILRRVLRQGEKREEPGSRG
ncbi:AMP-binding protein [Thermaerobacter composti]|uniref:AMP-binding protein n=1 Tax=Thermaerobacter composti TaxID=554949 RepID=A0ABZ0QPY2_9FIRM|nr:AMP-binding protein [Thermaerobacter composti]WPD18562.1 AMP-binding protein [Thermaerobacter composti]